MMYKEKEALLVLVLSTNVAKKRNQELLDHFSSLVNSNNGSQFVRKTVKRIILVKHI